SEQLRLRSHHLSFWQFTLLLLVKRKVTANFKSGVVEAGCEAEERISALCGVAVGIASVRWRLNRSSHRRKRKASEDERDEEESEPQRRPVNRSCYGWNCSCHFDRIIHMDLSFS